jgi:small subunit ribosomal protein S21
VQVLVRDNNVDQALKALKKKMQREGIFREMKLRGHYEKPSEKKAREKAEAVRRARKLARKKLQREGLLPMKPKPVFGAGPGAERGGAVLILMTRALVPALLFFARSPFRFETGLWILDLTRFLDANRAPSRIECGTGLA